MSVQNIKGSVSKLPVVDSTLTRSGYSADAKATGDAIAANKQKLTEEVARLDAELAVERGKIDQIANDQIPQEYLEAAVDNYVKENEAGLATKDSLEAVESELKSDLSKTNEDLIVVSNGFKIDETEYEFVYGSFTDGIQNESHRRICTPDYIFLPKGSKIKFDWEQDNCLVVCFYDVYKQYDADRLHAWGFGDGNLCEVTENSFVKIAIRKTTDDDYISEEEIITMAKSLKIYRAKDLVESVGAKITYLPESTVRVDGTYVIGDNYEGFNNIVMDYYSYYKIIDGMSYIHASCKFASGMYFRFYDENLKPLGNGGQSMTQSAKINVLASNNSNLAKDAKYLKLGFVHNGFYENGYAVSNAVKCKFVNENLLNEQNRFSEYDEKMQQMHMNVDRNESFVLVHFSDVHDDAENLQRIVEFSNVHEQYIDDVIHTGDAIKDNVITDNFNFWKSVSGSEKILNCIGNHDVWEESAYGNYAYTQAQAYEAYLKDYVSGWGVSYTENCNYYYKDYASKKIRLIVLDCMFDTAEQRAWFTNTLEDARGKGYTVLGVNHIPFTPSTNNEKAVTLLDSPFANEYRFNGWNRNPYEFMNDAYPTAVDTFIANGGSFACWLFGHTHFSGVGTLTLHENQMFVTVPNAGIIGANDLGGYRKKDTKTQDCFNVVAVDTARKCVKVMAVGKQYDCTMKYRDTMCYDYGNRKIIFT